MKPGSQAIACATRCVGTRRPRRLLALLAFCCAPWTMLLGGELDTAALQQALSGGSYGPVNALLIERSGHMLFEGYYRGKDAEQLQLLNSVTKSVGAVAMGMAIRRAQLDPAGTMAELLPQYDWSRPPLAANRDLRLSHVLSMRAGLQWDEWSRSFVDPANDFVRMTQSSDWYRHVLSLPQAAQPGQRFIYNTGSSILMSAVLRRISGQPPQDFLASELFAPLGISHWHWELWSLQGFGHGLRNFPYGDAPLGVGLWLRPRDLLKFGRMLLDDGKVGEQQLLDPAWIRTMFTRHNHAGNEPYFADSSEQAGYGYQWWYLELIDSRGRKHPAWYANGAGRQYLILFPELDLLVASTGDAYGYSGPGVFTLLRQQVLPRLQRSIEPDLSGSYYDPALVGEGLNIEVLADRGEVLAYWYTHQDGQQRFFLLQGPIVDDRAELLAYSNSGGQFQTPGQRPQLHGAGTATLAWDSCNRAWLDYDIELGSGRYELTRLSGSCPDRAPLP